MRRVLTSLICFGVLAAASSPGAEETDTFTPSWCRRGGVCHSGWERCSGRWRDTLEGFGYVGTVGVDGARKAGRTVGGGPSGQVDRICGGGRYSHAAKWHER